MLGQFPNNIPAQKNGEREQKSLSDEPTGNSIKPELGNNTFLLHSQLTFALHVFLIN